MSATRVTDRWLKTHRPDGREEWTDSLCPGLLIRFGSEGAVFYARLRVGGKYVRQRIGPYPAKSLEEAREKSRHLVRARDRGESPANPESFAGLCRLYIAQHSRPNKRTSAADERIIARDLIPALGQMRAALIRPRDVAALLDAVVQRGAPIQANRIRALLSRIFAFGLAREIVTSNPAAVTERPTKEKSRDTLLSDEQIAALWRALEYRAPTYRNLIRFLLLTAQRVSEAREMRWAEITGELWEVPGSRSKNGRPNVVPLSAQALAVLAGQRRLGIPGELVFPAPKNHGAPWDISSISSAARTLRATVGCEWQPKDLRRTAATIMSRLGHRPWVPRVLNHTEQGVTSVYDRHAYLPEKGRALSDLGAHVQAILDAAGLVALPAIQAATSERSQPTE